MMKNKILLTLCMSMPLLLVGCGGGDSPPSSTSSGVSVGTITGFGSVFVNGVKFETEDAIITRGGEQVQDDSHLELGMVVVVQGDIQNGIASSVSFEENVKGPADGVATGDTFSVMGQTVITNAATVFDDGVSLANIAAGDILEISGLRDANDAIITSFVEKKAGPADVRRYSVIGKVHTLDKDASTFMIGGLSINYSPPTDVNDLADGHPVDGQLVEVKDDNKGYAPGSLTLAATKVEPQNQFGDADIDGAELEIESIVTDPVVDGKFKMGNLEVQITDATVILYGTVDNIIVGTRLEVEGVLDSNGVLQAEKIEFEDNEVRITARVDIDGVDTVNNTVTLIGITVKIITDPAAEGKTEMEDENGETLTLTGISDGDYLEIEGFLGAADADGNRTFIASELEREINEDNKTEVEIRGPVTEKIVASHQVVILGLALNTNGSTEFEGLNDQVLTREQFFDAIVPGLTLVEAEWDNFDNSTVAVDKLELED